MTVYIKNANVISLRREYTVSCYIDQASSSSQSADRNYVARQPTQPPRQVCYLIVTHCASEFVVHVFIKNSLLMITWFVNSPKSGLLSIV